MKSFDLAEAEAILERTPAVFAAWLKGLPEAWLSCDEGPETWSAKVVLGHLIEGEVSDWIPRARHILEHGPSKAFKPFDRFAQLNRPPRTIDAMLEAFATARAESLRALRAMNLTPEDLDRPGLHPNLGAVTLGNLLATWVAHDMNHMAQIARVFARRYAEDVGPWRKYLRLLGGTA